MAPRHKKDRFVRMKRAEETENDNKNLIKLDGVGGLWPLWYEQPDMMSKYKRRPDEIEEMCSSHFGKMIASGGGRKTASYDTDEAHPEEEEDDPDDDPENELSDDEDPYEKFHYIITAEDEIHTVIPNIIN